MEQSIEPSALPQVFNKGQRFAGFTITQVSELPEIDGRAYLMQHELSGAKLLFLQNDDPNKSFAIGFKTPPADNTGTFHIIEHAVLCGSDRFPVKEPFVNLLKTSMQTFLNAMTFPDKTLYPVASTNERDLLNLADVYMDAVLHPAIYRKETIFQQEGWHLETADPNALGADGLDELPSIEELEAAGLGAEEIAALMAQIAEAQAAMEEQMADGAQSGEAADEAPDASTDEAQPKTLVYNGVVYNEMKGVMSDPDSVLFLGLSQSLFPDTAYRFESGGLPEAIPTLSYEAFLDNHSRHYRLDNSYLVLYGNLDARAFLTWLDERYLTPDAALRENAAAPNPLQMQAPVQAPRKVVEMVTAPENASAALAYVIGTAHDRERLVATDILLDAIMGSNEAPLKRAIFDAGLADDAGAFPVDGMLQPFAVIELKGLHEDGAARFKGVVDAKLTQLAEDGLDPLLLEAALSRAEFILRERDFGLADGVALSMNCLSGWLYDDDDALTYLRFDDLFATLRTHLNDGYFTALLRELFLENPHTAEVELVPVEKTADGEPDALAAQAEALSPADFEAIDAQVAALREAQERPDSAEELATLPQLHVSDIGPAPVEPGFHLEQAFCADGTPVDVLRHSVHTHGIVYTYRYYPLDGITDSELPYVSILAMVLGKLDTESHTAAELDPILENSLGSFRFSPEMNESLTSADDCTPFLVVGAAALPSHANETASLPDEVMLSTRFQDAERVHDILVQRRVGMEQDFANSGNGAAMARVASRCNEAARLRQYINGVEFYRFLKSLLGSWDSRKDELMGKLAQLARSIFSGKPFISFTGTDGQLEGFLANIDASAWNGSRCAGAFAEAANQDGLAAEQAECQASAPVDAQSERDICDCEGALIGEPGSEPSSKLCPAPQRIEQGQTIQEAFIVPTDVTFTATGFDRRLIDAPYHGSMMVASRVMSYDYLWNEVRVKGGAYGTGLRVGRSGMMSLYSYRDPHIAETIDRFIAAEPWLAAFNPETDEMEGYIVSTVAGLDAPEKARATVRKQDGWFFAGLTAEDHLKVRDEVLATTPAILQGLAPVLSHAMRPQCLCIFGNRELIEEAAKTMPDMAVYDLLGE